MDLFVSSYLTLLPVNISLSWCFSLLLLMHLNQVVCMSLLQKTLGPEFSQLHMLRPHDYAVCQQGPLWRLTEAGLLVKRTKRYNVWYLLFIHSLLVVCLYGSGAMHCKMHAT